MKICRFLVHKECVRGPNCVDVFGPNKQFLQSRAFLKGHPWVSPELSEVYVNSKILEKSNWGCSFFLECFFLSRIKDVKEKLTDKLHKQQNECRCCLIQFFNTLYLLHDILLLVRTVLFEFALIQSTKIVTLINITN